MLAASAQQGARGQNPAGRGTKKTPVMVLVERDGSARAKPVELVDRRTLQVEILRHVHGQSTIMTDEFGAYRGIGYFYGGRHATVNHGLNEYARRADGLSIHVNTAESSGLD